MIHLLKVLVKKIAKQSNITVIPCLLIYFSLDRLLLYLIFLNFAPGSYEKSVIYWK